MAHWQLIHLNQFATSMTIPERQRFQEVSNTLLYFGRGEDCMVAEGPQIDFFTAQYHPTLGSVCISQRFLRRETLLKEYTGEYKTHAQYQMETVNLYKVIIT